MWIAANGVDVGPDDNVMANSDASIQGHYWTSAASVPDYVTRNWAQNYGARGRPNDFGMYAVSWPGNGFLFDQAEREHMARSDRPADPQPARRSLGAAAEPAADRPDRQRPATGTGRHSARRGAPEMIGGSVREFRPQVLAAGGGTGRPSRRRELM
jgi:hypothetical protein